MSRRATGTAVIVCLIVAAGAAFARAEQLKLIRAPIAAPVVTRSFSSVCAPGPRCHSHVASIRFHLRKPDRVAIAIIDRLGQTVRALTPAAGVAHGKGPVAAVWNGQTTAGRRAPDGHYRVRVVLQPGGRTFILPEPLILDTTPPRLTLTVVPGSPIIAYKTSEQAVVYGVYTPVGVAGAHRWLFPGRGGAIHAHPAKMRKGVTYRVTVFAVDQAGNRSPTYPAGTFTP
jgi:FlgD Ig-like domain